MVPDGTKWLDFDIDSVATTSWVDDGCVLASVVFNSEFGAVVGPKLVTTFDVGLIDCTVDLPRVVAVDIFGAAVVKIFVVNATGVEALNVEADFVESAGVKGTVEPKTVERISEFIFTGVLCSAVVCSTVDNS